MVEITVLMDNKIVGRRGLAAEHGLSAYVEYQGRRLLFDCGPGPNFLANARRLGVDLSQAEAVVLSHSHYDHAGGFRDLAEANLGIREVYTGPGFWERKYAREGMRMSNLSCGFDGAFLQKYGFRHREVWGVEEMIPGAWLIGGFPRVHDFETVPERFVRRTAEGFVPDDFRDEVCMTLETEKGLVVLVGCAHPGIVNMVSHIRKTLGKPVWAVFGGTHLSKASPERIEKTLCGLKTQGVTLLGLGHCSGEAVEAAIAADPALTGCHLGSGDGVFLE